MVKIDLHTHSLASPDGSLALKDYKKALETNQLDFIAITDHDRIDFALNAHQALGERIIVGEEIATLKGEIIGLYLNTCIPGGLSLEETINRIKAQRGIVYIPHPFETKRKGIQETDLDNIQTAVDIIEGYNGRAWGQNFSERTMRYAQDADIATAASSDAHGVKGWGRTYTIIQRTPTRQTLVQLLKDSSTPTYKKPHLISILYPSINRLRRKDR